MRTNIEIDDELMRKALASSGSRTKKEAVDRALRMMVQVQGQDGLRFLKGILKDEGWGWDRNAASTRNLPDNRKDK